jgi:molybdopterin converting factor small subunit
MKIQFKCFANLPEKYDCGFTGGSEHDIQPGETVGQFASRMNMREEDIKIVFINGKSAAKDTPLNDGDRVAFAPAVGGM